MAQTKGTKPAAVSVVINTYNRGPSLRHTLEALRHQTHAEFEVVAVNGPSTDDTEKVLDEFPDARRATCPEVHLSKSRNVGIAEAAGEVVAFIDDDALPEPRWLEELLAAYDGEKVGGAGGIVFDHTGMHLQYRYSCCTRDGHPRFDVNPPFDEFTQPGADPFLYLQGTNCSFRRNCLVEIGGFDEEIEYFMDETDVCMRVLDRGYTLRALPNAAVHHKYLASHLRNSKKVVTNPYPNVKNYCYLLVLNNRERLPFEKIQAVARDYAERVKSAAYTWAAAGKFTPAQRDHFIYQVERGIQTGLDRGYASQRTPRPLPPAEPGRFRRYGTLRPLGKRLTVCFVSQEYPPGDFGGIGRFTADLATGFAAAGHEVHVVTRSPDVGRVDFEEGVWLHRLAAPERWLPALDGVPLAGCLFNAAAVYHEVGRIHGCAPLDVVSAPLWASEGAICALDDRFPTVLTLMTSLQTVAAMHPSWSGDAGIEQGVALERAVVRGAAHLHPISAAILEKVRADHGGSGAARVVPLGVRDRRDQYPRTRDDDGRVRVLFVGRLERRKGVDALLAAAVRLCRQYPAAEFVLAGKDTPNTETGGTYREAFEGEHGTNGSPAGRITFAGAVSEDELYQNYSNADIVCLPSRYESFGLVLVEGMAFGKPVVGCDAGGMREIVEVGGNGYLAAPGDADSLADCLGRLIVSAEERDAFGRRSRALYEERYALPVVVENTVRWYAEVAAARAGGGAAGAVAERLASLVAGATGLAAAAASEAAAGLLNADCYPVDYLAAVRTLWHLPADEFVQRLYNLLLNRDADPDGLAHYRGLLEGGGSREEVVRALAQSPEMAQAGRPAGWVEALGGVTGWTRYLSGGPRGWARRARNLARRLCGTGAGRALHVLRLLASPRRILLHLKLGLLMPMKIKRIAEGVERLSQREMQTSFEHHARQLQERYAVMAGLIRDLEAAQCQQLELLRREVRQLKLRQAEAFGALAVEQERQAAALHALLGGVKETAGADDVLPLGRADVAAAPARLNLDPVRSRAGWLAVAPRPGPEVDVVAELHRLPFAPGMVAEIDAGRLVERLTPEQLDGVLLPHWCGLLRPGGVLRLRCADWAATVRDLQADDVSAEEFARALATSARGGHSPESLIELLRRHGFERIEAASARCATGPEREAEITAALPLAALRAAV